ncbi:MAG: hypothetical protein KDE51_13245, partial [Anaerolineales bacterium]|nr:hypothetical protein [Anaerolineales bacterium]
SILSDDADPEEIAGLTRRLRNELLEIDIEDAEFAKGADLPEGAKSLGAIDWNTIILTLIGSGGVMTGLLAVFNSWVQRNPQTKIHLELPNGAQLNIEGSLQPGTELYNRALDILQLSANQQQEDVTFANDPSLVTLRHKMNEHLSLNEIKSIYFDLLLDYDQFGGESLNQDGKAQLLIKYCHRAGRVTELRGLCGKINGNVVWVN